MPVRTARHANITRHLNQLHQHCMSFMKGFYPAHTFGISSISFHSNRNKSNNNKKRKQKNSNKITFQKSFRKLFENSLGRVENFREKSMFISNLIYLENYTQRIEKHLPHPPQKKTIQKSSKKIHKKSTRKKLKRSQRQKNYIYLQSLCINYK